jgi:putative NADPH-quinone reductase
MNDGGGGHVKGARPLAGAKAASALMSRRCVCTVGLAAVGAWTPRESASAAAGALGEEPGVKILVVLAHPDAASFNHALAARACDSARALGHSVVFHDLYAEGFDPVLPAPELGRAAALDPALARHCTELAAADGIVVVHPNWWGQPPAVLAGWIDRVMRPGVAYEFLDGDAGEGVPRGLLRARAAVVLNTSNTEPGREQRAFGDPLESIWKRCVFGLCGVEDVRRRTYAVVVTSTPEQRRRWLDDAAMLVASTFPREA